MLISCLTITQPGRLPWLALAVGDFARQTYPHRELVVLHDGDRQFDQQLRAQVLGRVPEARVVAAEPGLTLGELRNQATQAAQGELLCQWDDDDRHHPERLSLQHKALVDGNADFCFLQDQLHWFANSGELFWDSWENESYPLNFIQGTLLGKRALMPAYPSLRRGEDTGLCFSLLRAGYKVARLRGQGWCNIYCYHGNNTFGEAHHRAISQLKQLSPARMFGLERVLRQRLAEYSPALRYATYTSPTGWLDFSVDSGKTTGSVS